MLKHEFDRPTFFCRRCGVSLQDVEDGRRAVTCEAGSNVVAISHRLAGGQLLEAVRKILGMDS